MSVTRFDKNSRYAPRHATTRRLPPNFSLGRQLAMRKFQFSPRPCVTRSIAGMSLLALLLALACGPVVRAAEEKLDEVSAQAQKLEADIAKLRDTSPEAADLLVKLADLYYGDGRVFGLIRVTETFVTKHSTHPKHREMMVKLIDGLLAMSRNKELTATCRQFLLRYPDDKECLRHEKDPGLRAGADGRPCPGRRRVRGDLAAPQRHARGRTLGVHAIWLYTSLSTADSFIKAAEQAEAMLDVLPAGEFAVETGNQSFLNWRRVGNWAKANVVGNKMLAKNLPFAPNDLRDLHYWMGEGYSALNQRQCDRELPQMPGARGSVRPACPHDRRNELGRFHPGRNGTGGQRVRAEISGSAGPPRHAQLSCAWLTSAR